MNFGEALQALKQGKEIKRQGWGGYWYLGNNVEINHDRVLSVEGPTDGCKMNQIIIAVLKNNQGCVPAMPYQQDLLAEDWQIVE